MGDLVYGPPGGTFGTGPALGVWQRIPRGMIDLVPGKGHGFFEHCLKPIYTTTTTSYISPGYYYDEYTDGTVEVGSLEGGVWKLGCGSATFTNQGAQIRTDPAFVQDTDCCLAFGCRYQMTDADKQNVVIGLAIIDSDYPGNITSTTADSIVFRHTGDATVFYQVNTGAGGMTAATTGATDISDAAWVTVDCFVNKESSIEFWVNGGSSGAANVTYTTTSNFPTDTPLAMVIANESTEGTNNYLLLDWFYAYQWRTDI